MAESGSNTKPAALLEVDGLEAYWRHHTRRGARDPATDQWLADRILLDALGLGLEQTLSYLSRETPDFLAFLGWIDEVAGRPDQAKLDRYHSWLKGAPPPPSEIARRIALEAMPPVLSPEALAQWHELGYVIIEKAITAKQAQAAAALVWSEAGADPDDPDSWYGPNDHGIMIQRFQHPAMEAARRSPRVHKAFAQLWGTSDLWMTTDRLSFNPPLRAGYAFRGPALHWDVSLATPIPFATQGILYLSDTAADQGALVLVPGFHRRAEAWLAALPPGADPRRQDLSGEAVGIAAGAGDLVIWHQALPHGASPNRSGRPRLAQYVNMYAPTEERRALWR